MALPACGILTELIEVDINGASGYSMHGKVIPGEMKSASAYTGIQGIQLLLL